MDPSYSIHHIAIVDDISLYSKKLIEGFRQKGAGCVLYGPRHSIGSKSPSVMEPPGPNTIRVWSQNRFPFQIFKEVAKDRPRLVHFQFEFFGIHSYGPLYTSLWLPMALLFLRCLSVKTVVTLHMVLPRDKRLALIRDTSPSTVKIPTQSVAAFLIFWYRTVSFLSHSLIVHADVFRYRLEEHYKVRASKIVVIPHGVDTFTEKYMEPKDEHAHDAKPILYFGVISPRKGLETLIAAYALLNIKQKNHKLLLAGTTPPYYEGYNDTLKTLAGDLKVGNGLQFLGTVSTQDAHELFRNAQFAVLPYSYDMSASGSLSWALGHGLPVVASKTDYFAEELSHEAFGLLVQPGEPATLANAMARLLDEEPLANIFAERSRRLGLARSWTNIAEKTLNWYETLTSQ